MNHHVVLKTEYQLTTSMAEKIKNLELSRYEQRFPIENEALEVYYSGSFEECYLFIQELDPEIKELFKIHVEK